MVVMSESSRQDEHRTSWKEAIKRRIAGLYSAALVGGQRHVEYLVELGMPRERIFTGYDVVDDGFSAKRRKRSEVRGRRSDRNTRLPENYFLASARFIEKKNLAKLVQLTRNIDGDRKAEVRSLKPETTWRRGTSWS